MPESIDPYAAPRSVSLDVGTGDALSLENAGKGRRFGTFIVDYIGFFVMMLVFGLVLGLAGGASWFESLGQLGQSLLSLGMMISYYLVFEGLWGRTPGKLLFGTRVVDEDGRQPGFGQVVGRTFARFIPFEAFSLLFSDKAVGWHDTLPKTRVVRAR